MTHVTWGIVIACGKGEQLTPEAEIPFLNLGSKPVLSYSLMAFEQCADISGVVVVVSKERMDTVLGMSQMFGFSKVQKVVHGGTQRKSAVLAGLKALPEEVTMVCVHDASRPCVAQALIIETIKTAKRYGSGVAAVEIPDVVKEVEKGLTVARTLKGGSSWAVQTPQSFKKDILEKAYNTANRKKAQIEDDSTALELIGEEVHLVPADSKNLRIRSADDFNLAMAFMKPASVSNGVKTPTPEVQAGVGLSQRPPLFR